MQQIKLSHDNSPSGYFAEVRPTVCVSVCAQLCMRGMHACVFACMGASMHVLGKLGTPPFSQSGSAHGNIKGAF